MKPRKLQTLLFPALLTLSQSAHSSITMESYWPLGEGAAIGSDTAGGTANPFNNTAGTTLQTTGPSTAAGSTKYARTSGTNYQGIWMFGGGATAQAVPADNWGVQLNVRIPTLPATGTYKAVFGMAEGVSAGLVIEVNNIGGTTYFDVNKQGTANYIIPRNASTTVTANTWYNLALVKSGGTITFYVNDVAVGSNIGAINTSGLLGLGFEQNVGTHQLAADFDEARFFTFPAGQFDPAVDLSMNLRSVAYNGNGNDSPGGTVPTDSASYFPGTSITVLGSGSMTRSGFTFSGWNTAVDGSGTAYNPSATFSSPDSNTTLYAQWTAVTATLTASATFGSPLTTTYGSASGAASVAVSGSNLTTDITATAPPNFEVSSDNTTFGDTATITQTAGSASGTLYLRIKNNAPVSGSYNAQNVSLTSTGASPISIATTGTGNTVTAKALNILSFTPRDKMFDGTTNTIVIGTLDTEEDFGTGSSTDGMPYFLDEVSASAPGTFASAAVGTGIAVTAGAFTLSGASAGNYTVNQPAASSLAASIRDTAVWTAWFGGSWSTAINWENEVVGAGTNNTADFSTLDLFSNATVTLDGAQTIGNLVFGDTDPSHNWTVNTGTGGPLTLAATSGSPTITVNNQTTTIGANLTGTQGLTKAGAGTLALGGLATGSPMNMTVTDGTLSLARYSDGTATYGLPYNNAGGLSNGGVITIHSAATLNVTNAYNIGFAQQVNIDGGTLAITNNVGGDGQNYTLNLNFTGGGTINGPGSLRWGELGDATITVNGTTPASIATDLWTISTGNKGGTIHVADAAGLLDFTGAIKPHTYGTASGPVPLTKTGPGTLILAGANTYTGATSVNGGTLTVSGSLGNTAVTVASGATLGGNGNLGGALTVQSGGHHALALAATAGAQVTRTITGALNLDSGNILDLTATTAPASGSYTLVTANGGITGTPTTVNLPAGVTGSVSVSGNSLVLTVGGDYTTWANTISGFTDTDPSHDPDGDGLTNFQEYAFGLDPMSGGGVSAISAPDRTAGTFTYTRRKTSLTTDVTYTYLSSTTLGGWSPFTPDSESSNNGNPVETITVTLPPALLANPNLFLRVQATQP